LSEGVQGELVQTYLNIPYIRPVHLAWNYRRKLRELVRKHGKPRVVITYNADAANCALGEEAQSLGIPWVSLVADMDDPGPAWSGFPPRAARADAHVFLSWHTFNSFPFSDVKLHLDAGVRDIYKEQVRLRIKDSSAKMVVLFAGSFTKWAGLGWLLEAFQRLPNQHVELWVCGKGDTRELEAAMASDSRIKHLGLKTREELHDIYMQADVLTNPRPYSLSGNAHNFPCKLLDSLAYCRPVVSSLTAGVSPEYRDLVVPVEEESPEALAAALDVALRMPADAREELAGRIATFLSSGKTWQRQGERLVSWLDRLNATTSVR
jgi:glycosyltransferase involved in cell wall biosynthesis